jgi:pimeloyl-ACP methyl ester carboxylesterase
LGLEVELFVPVLSADEPSEQHPADLALLVNDYVETSDAAHASSLLPTILRHPNADLATIQAILQKPPARTLQPIGSQQSLPIRVGTRSFRYGLYVPLSYTPTTDYALIVCLHGAGFSGDTYLDRWQSRLGEAYILACPTLPHGTWWTQEAANVILATIREVQARYRIDPDRIFLTGMSNGGIGVYLVGSHYAPLFAGLAPMAAGIDDVLFPFLANLRQTPVYLIHGVKDQVMPVELSRSIAEELTRLQYPFVYREHERMHPLAGGHFFPREELPDLVAWFDSRRRNPFPKRLTVVRDASHLTTFGWVRVDATERIAAFSEQLIDRRDDAIKNRVYAKLDAQIVEPNRIEVRTERVKRYSLFLNDHLVDLSRPLTVVTNGTVTFQDRVEPTIETLLREVRLRHDRRMLFPVLLTLSVPETPDDLRPAQ